MAVNGSAGGRAYTHALAPDTTAKIVIALQVSGHLRNLCFWREKTFHPLEDAVRSCRRHATCLVFVHTWAELHPPASASPCSKNHAWCRHREDASISLLEASDACAEEVHARLQPSAVLIEAQASTLKGDGVVPRFAGQWFYRGLSNHTGSMWHWNRTAAEHTELPAAGVRAMWHGMTAVSHLRRAHCSLFGCGAAADSVTMVVRMRPDLYSSSAVPNKFLRQLHMGPTARKWATAWGVPSWEAVVRHAHSLLSHPLEPAGRGSAGEQQHGASPKGNASSGPHEYHRQARNVFSCSRKELPADKGHDVCFWGTARNMDRLMGTLDDMADDALWANICWHSYVHRTAGDGTSTARRDQAAGRSRIRAAAAEVPAPCVAWAQLAPPSAPRYCDETYGCLVEQVVAEAITQSGLKREPMP